MNYGCCWNRKGGNSLNTTEKNIDAQWTEEQKKAIVTRGTNILVAAAAGSGKTYVLVQRILRRIADEENPVDVDRLLVVTFTKAAASEMKGRIRAALEQELMKRPYSVHLRRQLLLLARASISTLHSFCMEVIKRHIHQLDLDPAFRVADELEVKLLQQDVLDALFEERYGSGDQDFYQLVDWFSNDRSDVGLQRLVLRLYEFAQSNPLPNHWLEEMSAMYDVKDSMVFEDLPWVRDMRHIVSLELQKAISHLQQAIALTRLPLGPSPYLANLERELAQFELALSRCQGRWEELDAALRNIEFARLPACRGEEYDPALIDQVKAHRDQAKGIHKVLLEKTFAQTKEDIVSMLRRMAPVMDSLVGLVKEYGEWYRKAKLEKGIVDFADLEHYTLQLLRDPHSGDGEWMPSEIAQMYQQHFEEILVDEYQDTNKVQETILALISKPSIEGGNRFMVGDVKQSIYRFRQTEPGLFLEKYHRYSVDGNDQGLRIDLSRNFRSRAEVLLGANFVFRQIMRADVAELDYDKQAELVVGASFPEIGHNPMELHLIDRNVHQSEDYGEDSTEGEEDSDAAYYDDDPEDLENAELEARWIAARIQEMVRGKDGGTPYQVYDKQTKQMRNVQYRDIVILLRSAQSTAGLMLEQFREHNIPAYAEVSGGYFAATEVETMLSLLRIIDNPYQDIPLSAVLRSPIVQLRAEELAQIRLCLQDGSYYEALKKYIETAESHDPLGQRLEKFHKKLEEWRIEAQNGALSDLIWRIYQDTGYLDFVGGLPGGKERQANLRALYDRARQFEQSAYRGLFRFLRFIERMQERGEEMGTARALGEQEDVVRIMTIHKSKGLEFPIVFIAGLSRKFHLQDLYQNFLYHKELGFGTKMIDTELRIAYPTLPQLAIQNRLLMETLAEEQRLLYVAMTRAKEKCILIGTVRNAAQSIEKWSSISSHEEWQLPPHTISTARSYLEWIGPALIRHRDVAKGFSNYGYKIMATTHVAVDPSAWSIHIIKADRLPKTKHEDAAMDEKIALAIQTGTSIEGVITEHVIHERLSWQYPFEKDTKLLAKQSVSEIKRKAQMLDRDEDEGISMSVTARPQFMEQTGLTALERGTATHMVMQQLSLDQPITYESITEQIALFVEKELLTHEQAQAVKINDILGFFASECGERLRRAKQVLREVPFSLALSTKEMYKRYGATIASNEPILVQGIIDVLMEEEDGWVLLDYKTDHTYGYRLEDLYKRYETQLDLYALAFEKITGKTLKEKILYFLDGGKYISKK